VVVSERQALRRADRAILSVDAGLARVVAGQAQLVGAVVEEPLQTRAAVVQVRSVYSARSCRGALAAAA
jgi:hypothetical protein